MVTDALAEYERIGVAARREYEKRTQHRPGMDSEALAGVREAQARYERTEQDAWADYIRTLAGKEQTE